MSIDNVIWGADGAPLAMSSDKIFAVTSHKKTTIEEPKNSFSIGGMEFVSWGENNRYPDDAVKTIGSTGVLSTAIGFKARTSFGQGVVPMVLKSIDDDGNDVLEVCKDTNVQKYCRSYEFRNYASQAFRDLFKFGNCFPIFYFSEDGTKIIRLVLRNARHCRVSRDKKKLLVYPDFWKSTPSEVKDVEIIDMLSEDDPFSDLERLKVADKLRKKVLAFPRIRNYYSNNDFYGVPDWDAAYRSGWIDVANKVPLFLKRSYENAMTLMWHIQIPSSYWEQHFPLKDFGGSKEERQKAISDFMQRLEDSMCGDENSAKSLITDFTMGQSGRAEERWSIERLKNEIDTKERLSTSAAANSEILFSMMINPSTLGAGMPGGAYAGSAGSGSDIRESYLVSVITTYLEKQQILDPVRLMLRFNGAPDDMVLKYKETILTTLNTGQSKMEVTT